MCFTNEQPRRACARGHCNTQSGVSTGLHDDSSMISPHSQLHKGSSQGCSMSEIDSSSTVKGTRSQRVIKRERACPTRHHRAPRVAVAATVAAYQHHRTASLRAPGRTFRLQKREAVSSSPSYPSQLSLLHRGYAGNLRLSLISQTFLGQPSFFTTQQHTSCSRRSQMYVLQISLEVCKRFT